MDKNDKKVLDDLNKSEKCIKRIYKRRSKFNKVITFTADEYLILEKEIRNELELNGFKGLEPYRALYPVIRALRHQGITIEIDL